MPKTMTRKPAHHALTFEDFCFLVKDGQKADLIDGVIYLAPPDNTDAFRLSKWLLTLLDDFALERDLGEVFGFRVAFRLDEANAPEPDIGFVCKAQCGICEFVKFRFFCWRSPEAPLLSTRIEERVRPQDTQTARSPLPTSPNHAFAKPQKDSALGIRH